MKLYAYLAAAVLLIGLIGGAVHVVKKANRAEAAEAALAGERSAHKAQLAQVEKALAASLVERQKLNDGLKAITERFNKPAPPPKTLVKIVEVPGACPRVGVSDEFVRLWNESGSP